MEKAIAVRVIGPYRIGVTFADGVHREIDLEGALWGADFAPLRDPGLFAQAVVDLEAGSVTWPMGADLSPEFLYFGNDGPPEGFSEPASIIDSPHDALSEAR